MRSSSDDMAGTYRARSSLRSRTAPWPYSGLSWKLDTCDSEIFESVSLDDRRVELGRVKGWK